MKLALLTFATIVTLIFTSCTKEELNTTQNFENENGDGFKPSSIPISKIATVPLGGSVIPDKYDLSHLMPPIRQQAKQGSCVGFALSYLKSYHERLENGYSYTDNSKIMSPSYIYNQIKYQGDCDAGSDFLQGLDLLVNRGVLSESEFPYVKSDCSNQPTSAQFQASYKNRIKDWGSIDIHKSDFLEKVKLFVSKMQPVLIGLDYDENFATLGMGNPFNLTWSKNNTKYAGSHAMIVVGYDDSKNAFKVWNSWGEWWGNDGWIWIDYDMFKEKVLEAYVTWDYIGGPQSQGTGGTDPCTSFKLVTYQGVTNIGFDDDDIILIQGDGGIATFSLYIDGVFNSSSTDKPKFAVAVPHKAGHTYNVVIKDKNGCEISRKIKVN
jgi:cathepsin K